MNEHLLNGAQIGDVVPVEALSSFLEGKDDIVKFVGMMRDPRGGQAFEVEADDEKPPMGGYPPIPVEIHFERVKDESGETTGWKRTK